ncbi:hypothetical protein BT63DRAFT_475273 [Microthyrium microscopicum]|uniref:Uncharacterized protein n=1 Tax=Microthyrium microscopicum TaxID=703497 RepID=A0A6A6UMH6_9PEZI|nr:hypothetical protein BT63DRAFT_475273 [Microthyrium microscopicum]
MRIHEKGLEEPFSISIYPGGGTADGVNGDHVLLAPKYNSDPEEIEEIVNRTAGAIKAFFKDFVA